jgi:hypothetical protein
LSAQSSATSKPIELEKNKKNNGFDIEKVGMIHACISLLESPNFSIPWGQSMEGLKHLDIDSDGSSDLDPLSLSFAHNSLPLHSDSSSFLPLFQSHSRHRLFTEVSTNLLRSGHAIRFLAKGESMYPTIRDREAITVEPISPLQINREDIVLYETRTHNIIAHRVIRIIDNVHFLLPSFGSYLSPISSFSRVRLKKVPLRFILRGDALEMCDEPVEPHQILGKVIFVERRGCKLRLDGRMNKFIQHTTVYLLRLRKHILKTLGRIFF